MPHPKLLVIHDPSEDLGDLLKFLRSRSLHPLTTFEGPDCRQMIRLLMPDAVIYLQKDPVSEGHSIAQTVIEEIPHAFFAMVTKSPEKKLQDTLNREGQRWCLDSPLNYDHLDSLLSAWVIDWLLKTSGGSISSDVKD